MSILRALFIAIISIFILLLASSRNACWTSELTIWQDAAKKSPKKPRPRNNLGGYYLLNNNLENAVKEFKEAVKLKPDSVEAINNLGFAYYDMGLYKEALVLQEEALRINPNFRNAHFGYALLMERLDRLEEAKKSWEAVVRLSRYDDRWSMKAAEHIKKIQKSKIKNQK